MLRPEIVKQYPVPLSSDAFTGTYQFFGEFFRVTKYLSGWSKYDSDIEGSERDIRGATWQMLEEVIPSLAKELDSTDISDLFERVLKDDAVCLASTLPVIHLCTE